jgi:hypothetical protein
LNVSGEGIACLEVGARLASAAGEHERAARLAAAAQTLREAAQTPLPADDRTELDEMLALASTSLGEEAFTAAWTAGREMTLEQAILPALEGLDALAPPRASVPSFKGRGLQPGVDLEDTAALLDLMERADDPR